MQRFPRFNRPGLRGNASSALLGYADGDGSTLTLDFTTGVLDPRLTFTRTSNATFINSSGLVQYAFSNRIPNSASLSGFAASGVTAVADSNEPGPVVAPSGTQATKVTVNGGATTVNFSRNFGTGAGTSTGMTYSIYLKPSRLNNGSGFRYAIRNETTGLNTYGVDVVWANSPVTVNEVIGAADGDYQLSGPDANGWYRLILMVTNTGLIRPGDNLTVYAGYSGQSTGFFDASGAYWVWGAQLEPGLTASPVYLTGATSTGYFDVPRFDYDPTTPAPRGLLIEGTATNLLQQSAAMRTSPWSTANLTTAGASITAPDGTANGVELVWTNTTAIGLGYTFQEGAVAASTAYTMSVYLKPKGVNVNTALYIQARASTTSLGYMTVSFVHTSGNMGAVTNGPFTSTSATSTNVGNGWYRVTVTGTSPATTDNIRFFIVNASIGNGTDGVYAWGAQLEAGSGASSYIPTGASTVQRLRDEVVLSNLSGISFNQSAGTVYSQVEIVEKLRGSFIPYGSFDTSGGGRCWWWLRHNHDASVGQRILGTAFNSGGSTAITSSNYTHSSGVFKFATSLDPVAGRMVYAIAGGSAQATNASGFTLATAAQMSLNKNSDVTATDLGSMWVRSIKYWPTALPDATLQSLTT